MESPDKKKKRNRRKKPQSEGEETPRQPEAGPSVQQTQPPAPRSQKSEEELSRAVQSMQIKDDDKQKGPGQGKKKNKQQKQDSRPPQEVTRPVGLGGPPEPIWTPRPGEQGPPGQTEGQQQRGPPGQKGAPRQPWGQQQAAPPGQAGPPGQPWGQQQTGPPGQAGFPGQPWGQQQTGPPGQPWSQQQRGPPGQAEPHGQPWGQQQAQTPGQTGLPNQAWRQQQTGSSGQEESPRQPSGQQQAGPPGQAGPPEQAWRQQQPEALGQTRGQQQPDRPKQSVPPQTAPQRQEQKPPSQAGSEKKGGKKQQKPQEAGQPQRTQTPRETAQVPKAQDSPRPPQKEPSPRGGPQVALSPYKGAGTLGRPVKFETNYVKMDLSKLKDVAYHYDVAIDPDRPKKLLSVAFEKFRQKHFPNVYMAFDRMKLAYTVVHLNLPQGGLTDEVEIDDVEMSRKKRFKVSIQETDDYEVKMSLLKSKRAYEGEPDRGKVARALQCLEIVMRMAALGGVKVSRQCYWPPERQIALDGVMELWTGIFHSAVFGARPLMNVDITNKGFPMEMSVLNVMRESRIDFDRPDSRYMDNVQQHLGGLNISYAPKGNEASRRVYKFLGFKGPAHRETFTHEDRRITVEQYFRSMNMPLKYPNLPVLHVGPRDKNILLPAEYCSIPGGQAVMKKLTDMQTRSMIKYTATSTDERKKRILEILRKVNFNASPVVQDFGIRVDSAFVDVNARILDAPKLEYAGRKSELPRDGVWQMRQKQFIVPTTIDKWAVLVLEGRPDLIAVDRFVKSLVNAGRDLNMTISPPQSTVQVDIRRNESDFVKKMAQWKGNVKMLLVVIPDSGNAYQKVKRAAETEFGILTQCIKHTTIVRRGDLSTVNNLLLKINSKLNGLNHRIMSNLKLGVLKDGKFMVVGADVTHPSPDQRNIPSIVGMASSYDEDGFRYTGMWRIQDPRREMIDDLAQMIHDHLIYYKKERKGVLPEIILYYRDGVGEGDFQRVLNLEFLAIHKGAARVQANYKPKVVFIVVQKRHHTRFFPGKSGVSVGRNNNVPPGTIVDTEIVPANTNQFFLVAHQAIQGVAKPTKYCVLVDEANVPVDDLQALTYNLCHMFTRCNRAVSYVAPTYYAHLMAARGKVYVEGDRLDMNNLNREYQKRIIKDEVHKQHPMFFV